MTEILLFPSSSIVPIADLFIDVRKNRSRTYRISTGGEKEWSGIRMHWQYHLPVFVWGIRYLCKPSRQQLANRLMAINGQTHITPMTGIDCIIIRMSGIHRTTMLTGIWKVRTTSTTAIRRRCVCLSTIDHGKITIRNLGGTIRDIISSSMYSEIGYRSWELTTTSV